MEGIYWIAFIFLSSVVFQPAMNTVIPTECCLCDDASPLPSLHCSRPGVCENSFHLCDFCETKKQFINNKWMTKRSCGFERRCITNWYHTITTLGCVDNTRGEPPNGTTCFYCCGAASVHSPRDCQREPDVNYIHFNVTTSAPTTTQVTTQSVTTTVKTVADNDRFCEVGENGDYNTTQCDVTAPSCMNTVVISAQRTIIIKKGCENRHLCQHDWQVTKNITECVRTDVSRIPTLSTGIVCHYCCNSHHGATCNKGDIPASAKHYAINNAASTLVG